jgi:hypothetical protein
MPLSPTAITPVVTPNSIVLGHASAAVYPPLAGSATNSNDVGAAEQIIENQIFTLASTKANAATDSVNTLQRVTLNSVGIGGGSTESFTTLAYTASAVVLVNFASVAVGDVIDASLVFDVETSAAAGDFLIKLVAVQDFGGANDADDIPGAEWLTRTPDRIQATIQGALTVVTAGPLRVRLEARCPSEPGEFIRHYSTGCLIVRRTHVGA